MSETIHRYHSLVINSQAIGEKYGGKFNDGRYGCLEHTAGILGLFWGIQRRLFKRINTNLIWKAEWSRLYERGKGGMAKQRNRHRQEEQREISVVSQHGCNSGVWVGRCSEMPGEGESI